MEYRINGFEQIKSFYSWVFNNAHKRVTSQHISLYLFLINQNNRNNWVEWFKCPYDLGMSGACIGNKKTYYKCLADLQEWNLIEYEKGINEFKSPLIKIEVLKSTSTDTATVPQSEPLPTPLPILLPTTLPTPLPTHIYKLITDNLKHIDEHLSAFESFINTLTEIDNQEYSEEDNRLFKQFNEWTSLNTPKLNKLKRKFTISEFVNLKKVATFEEMKNVFMDMENHKDLLKKYDWAYRTALNWIKRNKK